MQVTKLGHSSEEEKVVRIILLEKSTLLVSYTEYMYMGYIQT